ncbi:MAG: M13 family metallopeptidase [Bacteroidia bacterium]|nr:M13 family metallopeptidase [Bacteroidia bacterium]
MNRFNFLLLIGSFVACTSETKMEETPIASGLELSNMDTTIRPQDDFFRFVNGNWINRTAIPSDRGSWGSFNELAELNNKTVLDVLKRAGENPKYTEGTDQRKAADFFSIGMDSSLAETAGMKPLEPTLKTIEAIQNKSELQAYLVEQELEGGGAFFSFQVFPDLKNSKKMAAYLGSGGIGLPERDYYLKSDEKSKETREKYKEHVSRMLVLIGQDASSAKKSAESIVAIESQLAKATLTKEESRDPVKQYNKKSIPELSVLAPSINWESYFQSIGVGEDSIIVTEPVFMKGFESVLNSYGWNDIKVYLKWTALRGSAPFLNHEVVQESFDFNSKYMRGVDQMRPRWKRVLNTTDVFLGEAIGKLYVDENFPPEAKRKALEMVENIKFAFADRIKNVDWMSDSTKKASLKKLSTFNVKIGYPDEWKNYSGLLIEKSPEKSSYYQNAVNASKFVVQQNIAKLGKPVNTKEWGMNPQTVNAYYNPLFNEIVFPAGILQPPFYNYKADEAVNYGGIGAVIGHEISHGFDDQGSQFDSEGNLKNWWLEEDLQKFKAKGKALSDQFSKYEPLPDVLVQGEFTLGENIGDLGGLNVAYDGLQRFYREHEKPGLIDGYSPEQRFYLSWATVWRIKYKDETLRTQVNTDPHAPGMFRANGPISNIVEFYDAFGVKSGDKMYREEKDRVKIW